MTDGGDTDPRPIVERLRDVAERVSSLEEANAGLQRRLGEAQGDRREERFLWIIACVILADVVFLNDAKNITLPLVVLVLELLLLVLLAFRYGIGRAAAFVDKTLSQLTGTMKPPSSGD